MNIKPKTVEELIAAIERLCHCELGDSKPYHTTSDGLTPPYLVIKFAVGLPFNRAEELMCLATYYLIERWVGPQKLGLERRRLFWRLPGKISLEEELIEQPDPDFDGVSEVGAYTRLCLRTRIAIVDALGVAPDDKWIRLTAELLEDIGVILIPEHKIKAVGI